MMRRGLKTARLAGLNLSTWTVVTSPRAAHHGVSWYADSQRALHRPQSTLIRAAVISF
jgi:hypothetical protein